MSDEQELWMLKEFKNLNYRIGTLQVIIFALIMLVATLFLK